MIDIQSIVAMMYKDTCTIVERQKVKDPSTKKTEFKEVIVLKDQPCRLSYKSFPETSVDNVARMTQQVKLFPLIECLEYITLPNGRAVPAFIQKF